MQFKVIKGFKDLDGSFKVPGDSVEAEGARARLLRQARIIGGRVEEPPKEATEETADSGKDALITRAKELGIEATRRWGEEKLRTAIEAAEKDLAPPSGSPPAGAGSVTPAAGATSGIDAAGNAAAGGNTQGAASAANGGA